MIFIQPLLCAFSMKASLFSMKLVVRHYLRHVMNEHEKSTEIEKVPCEICLKEIPKSEAEIAEASDYFYYFCGLDCYGKWKNEMKDQ